MIIESIVFVILICSLGGIFFVLSRKAPAVKSLPHYGTTGIRKHRFISDIEENIKEVKIYFDKQIFLHKLLSWVKVMTLKIETRVDKLLHKIRQKNKPV